MNHENDEVLKISSENRAIEMRIAKLKEKKDEIEMYLSLLHERWLNNWDRLKELTREE